METSTTNKTILAICAPTHSIKSWKSLSDTSLQTLLIPSIERTVTEQELKDWDVRLYLGIDHDDGFWLKHHESFEHPSWLTIDRGFYEVHEHRVPFNEMMQHAYDDGAEYMVRVNDDTEFVTKGWMTLGVATLRGFDPSNVGVVGPTCRQGNTKIMTHDMVHRTHLDIFDHYYPTVFSAWWVDDWITKVYEPGRSIQLKEWEVKHHTGKHGTRYKVQGHEKKLLTGEVVKGKERVADWVVTRQPIPAIDIVFLWVNGSAHNNDVGTDATRVRDWGELRVSVQLAHRNIRPLGRVFVITAGERPWYAHEMPYVEWVTHSEFMPAERLPTFNSLSIQFSLGPLVESKTLSDPFLLFDDDFFVRAPVEWTTYAQQHYLSDDGQDWVRLPPSSRQFVRAIQHTNHELTQFYGTSFRPTNTMAHMPFTVRHASLRYAAEQFHLAGSYTTVRAPSNLQFQYLLAQIDRMGEGRVPLTKAGSKLRFVMRTDDVERTQAALNKACRSKTAFVCVNDDVLDATPQQRAMMEDFLACMRRTRPTLAGRYAALGGRVAGAATLARAAAIQRRHGFVFLQLLNDPFVPMTQSWVCRARQFPGLLDQVLFVATDAAARDRLLALGGLHVAFEEFAAAAGPLYYGQKDYFNYMLFRTGLLLSLLRRGVRLWLVEADATWFANPAPALRAFAGMDVVTGNDGLLDDLVPEGGFIFLNATRKTVAMWAFLRDQFQGTLLRARDEGYLDGGVSEMRMLPALLEKFDLRWAFFPTTRFVAGKWYMREDFRAAVDPLVIHNNYVIGTGTKIARAKKWGHWFLDEEGKCAFPVAMGEPPA